MKKYVILALLALLTVGLSVSASAITISPVKVGLTAMPIAVAYDIQLSVRLASWVPPIPVPVEVKIVDLTTGWESGWGPLPLGVFSAPFTHMPARHAYRVYAKYGPLVRSAVIDDLKANAIVTIIL